MVRTAMFRKALFRLSLLIVRRTAKAPLYCPGWTSFAPSSRIIFKIFLRTPKGIIEL